MGTASEIIRKIRGSLSQPAVQARVREQFPHVTGVIPTALSHWETGRRSPPPLQLFVIYSVADDKLPDAELMRLIQQLSDKPDAVGQEYKSLIASWPANLSVSDRVASFCGWARAHAARPPRGKARR